MQDGVGKSKGHAGDHAQGHVLEWLRAPLPAVPFQCGDRPCSLRAVPLLDALGADEHSDWTCGR
eukprot:10482336-Alexandrium_andersonii.AAC.1